MSGSNVSLSLKCSLQTIDANYPEFPYSTNTLNFILWSICVVIQDAKACHFQYYKYLLQILVLMLSLKRKETLLRVQCTGDSYQYFSSKVKHYVLPGSCPFALFWKFSVLPLESCMCFPAPALTGLRAENLNLNPAWDVCLLTFSSVPYVAMSPVKERLGANVVLARRGFLPLVWESAAEWGWVVSSLPAPVVLFLFLPYSWPWKNQ